MTLALTNVDLLHRGWEDAVSEITPHLPELRATMETEYAALLHDNSFDEESLLAAVREVATVASRVAGADKARLLSRALHRAVYEYLLSLDALTAEETDGPDTGGGVATDTSRLIGVEEVAELEGRQSALRAEAEAAAAAVAAAEQAAIERAAAEREAAERAAAEAREAAERAAAEAQVAAERAAVEAQEAAERAAAEERAAAVRAAAERAAAEQAAADRAAAHKAAADRAAADRAAAIGPDPAGEPEMAPDGDDQKAGYYRPRFKLFRKAATETAPPAPSGASPGPADTETAARPGAPEWWRGPEAPPAPFEPTIEPAATPEAAEPAALVRPAPAPAKDTGFTVAPRDGFHLTEFADFVRPAAQPDAERVAGVPAEPAPSSSGDGEKARGWHIRSSRRPHSGDDAEAEADEEGAALDDEDTWEERRLHDQDPKVLDAHTEINDLLRRRRCDEAAALLQKLAADDGTRSVAELALDAGDRCRALGKGNAALSCYIAASRADPSFEGPLMRLADVCLDDRDIDLAVTYLERVARLHRARGDTRGALRLYRKIVTIAPYRDDIRATLMRANTTGQFED